MTKRPHIDIDAILAEGVGTVSLFGETRTVLPMSSAAQHTLATLDLSDAGDVLKDDRIERWTSLVAQCLRPTVEPTKLRELPGEHLMAIISMANASSLAVQEALAEGNGQAPAATTPPAATPSPS